MTFPAVIDANGIQIPTLAELQEQTFADIRGASEFGPDANLSADSVAGQIVNVVLERIDESYQLNQSIYNATDPDNAEGQQLDNIAGLAGILREAASSSKGTVTLSGTPATLIVAGKRVKLPNVDGSEATLDADATIGGGGTIDGEFTAVATGPISYPDTTVLDIVDPVAGWTGAVVAEPVQLGFSLGRNIETDGELRIRREQSFSLGGSATDQAVGAKVRARPDVDFAAVISNRTLVPDSKLIPGKAGRTVVFPGTADGQEIINVVFQNWPVGIESDGALSFSVTDSEGQVQTFKYSIAATRDVNVRMTISKASNYGGDTAVKDALEAYSADSLNVGVDVRQIDLECRVLQDVDGVDNIVTTLFFTGDPGSFLPLTVDVDEIGDIDAANVLIFTAA